MLQPLFHVVASVSFDMLFGRGPADGGAWLTRGASGRRRWGRRMGVLRSVEALGRARRARGAMRRRTRRAAGRAGGARLAEGLADWTEGALGTCAWSGSESEHRWVELLSGRPDVRGAPAGH